MSEPSPFTPDDPFAGYPNPETARRAAGVNLFGKMLGLAGIDESPDQDRTRTSWGEAAANTVGGLSLLNALHDFGQNAKQAVTTADPRATFAATAAVPFASAPLAAAGAQRHGAGFGDALPCVVLRNVVQDIVGR